MGIETTETWHIHPVYECLETSFSPIDPHNTCVTTKKNNLLKPATKKPRKGRCTASTARPAPAAKARVAQPRRTTLMAAAGADVDLADVAAKFVPTMEPHRVGVGLHGLQQNIADTPEESPARHVPLL